ncbi:hypothetical protein [Nocardioides sp.]|uniref:hypothetical protein n=1 Tax=Nocardioides sp. TaxID=35761 RepID=UPI00260FF564|nr:hypothetical protein [Nocardioides sp.]MCW2736101.1 hypothetical protein [Nocardioides sp.]
MGRRVLEVEFAGVGSLVRGYGSRDIVISVTGRAPLWSSVRRGWSLQESSARDVVAAAEALNYDVVITGRRAVERNPANTPRAAAPDPGGLW